jgi:type II secretory pathway component GspD/PulD (secretin)
MKRVIRAAAIAAALAFAGIASAQDSPRPEEPVEAIVQRIAAEKKAVASIDEALRGKRIPTATEGLPVDTVCAVLADYGVEIVEYEAGGRPVVRALLQRNVAQCLMSLEPVMLSEKDPLPPGNRLVTKSYTVRHADANGVQTAIRALMTRDPRRVGNIIYVQATDSLVITDLTSALRQYERIIADLDRPSARAERLKNLRIDIEVWHVPTAATLDALRDEPANATQTVRAGGSQRVASFSGIATDPATRGMSPPVSLTTVITDRGDAAKAGDDTAVTVTATIEADRTRMAIRLSAKVWRAGADLVLHDRAIGVERGVWTLAFSGDPGFAILLRAREE